MKLIHLGLSVSRLAILVCAIIAIQSGIAHAQTLYMGRNGVKTYDLASDTPINEDFIPRQQVGAGFNADNNATTLELLNPAFVTGYAIQTAWR